jgi:hypothetical protein
MFQSREGKNDRKIQDMMWIYVPGVLCAILEGGMSRTCSICRQNEKYVLNLIRKSEVKAPIGKP